MAQLPNLINPDFWLELEEQIDKDAGPIALEWCKGRWTVPGNAATYANKGNVRQVADLLLTEYHRKFPEALEQYHATRRQATN